MVFPLQESFGTLVAQVVEVTVDQGEVSVDRVVLAADPGFAVSPDGLTAQMESGVISRSECRHVW